MATKANAHYCDCDINPTTLEWTCTGEGVPGTYEYMWFSQNGAFTGVPLGDAEMVGGVSAGPAVDVGGGVTGLPAQGHPWSAGMTVRVFGTTHHDGEFTVQSSTTENRLDINDPFVAETFDGTEQVYRQFTVDSGFGRGTEAPDGTFVYGAGYDGVGSYLQYANPDTETATWDSLPWTAAAKADGGQVSSIKFSDDGNFLYVLTGERDTFVSKFDWNSKTLEWCYYNIANPAFAMDLDSSGNAYLSFDSVTNSPVHRLSSDGQTLTKLNSTMGDRTGTILGEVGYHVVANDAMQLVVGGGQMKCLSGSPELFDRMYNLGVRSYDNANGDTMQLGAFNDGGGGPIAETALVVYGGIVVTGGFIYVCVIESLTTGSTLYKLSWNGSSLTQEASVAGPTYGKAIFEDAYGNIVCVQGDSGIPTDDRFWVFDTDLNLVDTIENCYGALLTQWFPGGGEIYMRGDAFPEGVVGTDGGVTPGQSRALWTPSDYSHLNGETVQVLGDGAYLGTDTVANGAITLDDNTTTNHVGLGYTSYLQPMKLDGEVHVKNIKRLYLQLYNTIGGWYGEELTRLWEIIFRDRDDTFGDSTDLFEGFKELDFDGSYDRSGDIWITHDTPLPMTVLGIIARTLMEDGSQ